MTVTVKLTESTPEHIRFSDANTSFCEADCTNDDARCVPGDRDPVADASLHLCLECADEWARIVEDIEREPTVQCACDRIEDEHAWTCGRVVPVTVARALEHPAADGPAPVCPDCYEWVCNHPANEVSTPLEDAVAWADRREWGNNPV
jgi:hypothetical protein